MKELTPPGIVSFRSIKLDNAFWDFDDSELSYKEWVRWNFETKNRYIDTIQVGNEQFSVGEKVNSGENWLYVSIKSFEWDTGRLFWWVHILDSTETEFVVSARSLSKLPPIQEPVESQVQPIKGGKKKTAKEILGKHEWVVNNGGGPDPNEEEVLAAMEEYLQQSPWEVIGPKVLEVLKKLVDLLSDEKKYGKLRDGGQKLESILKEADELLKDK